ncbi:hypothetical protein [Methylobacter luteus]|uniref:hypothetical protein n=1 Tax=Methylobacter luteus TaxID=415 RepID=UPI0012DDC3C4|nr:hypothetical protein [Methylobacter luteus]
MKYHYLMLRSYSNLDSLVFIIKVLLSRRYLNRVLRKTALFFALAGGCTVQIGNSAEFVLRPPLMTACVGWVGALAETRHGRPERLGLATQPTALKVAVPGAVNGLKMIRP